MGRLKTPIGHRFRVQHNRNPPTETANQKGRRSVSVTGARSTREIVQDLSRTVVLFQTDREVEGTASVAR
jgi:hypothetical protein